MDTKANVIFERLKGRFKVANCELEFSNNFELLVAVMLSARCTDKKVNQVTKSLFKIYPTPICLANAKQEELEQAIYSCGFYKNKAKNLINMAKDLIERFDGQVPSNFDDLLSLSGVGRKTANVCLYVGFKKPAIAVDTHVFRLSNRLGLCKTKTPLDTELVLQKLIDKKNWGEFHHLLVLFGRYVCKSQRPLCQECELRDLCDFYAKNR
jgi:endonuclease III